MFTKYIYQKYLSYINGLEKKISILEENLEKHKIEYKKIKKTFSDEDLKEMTHLCEKDFKQFKPDIDKIKETIQALKK